MPSVHEQAVAAVVQEYSDSILTDQLRALRAIDRLVIEGGHVELTVRLGMPAAHYGAQLRAALSNRIRGVEGVNDVTVEIQSATTESVPRKTPQIGAIKNIVAVASGKGGVGKSTTAVNLALGLAYEGAQVGLLDADIYGPSQTRMLGLRQQRFNAQPNRLLEPPIAYGVKTMSMGLLVDEEQPMVWRGPMVTQALNQLLMGCDWGELDYLVVDMPPGTGDIQLTLAQRVPVSGAVIVTTPQDIALLDARKGLKMFQKVEVPVLGIVENMSTHLCSKCGHEEHIFGAGGGQRMAEQYGVELLASLPLDIRIREQTDGGRPTVVAEPESPLGRAYIDMARRVAARLWSLAALAATPFPKIEIENT